MSSSSSDVVSDITDTDAEEKFLVLDNFNVVPYLFNNGLLNDIECRKIVLSKNIEEIQAGIYEIIFTKDSKTVKKILETFRNCLHPFQNPMILQRIFSYLKCADIKKCKRVCPDWKQIVDSIFNAKFSDNNLDKFLLMKILGNIEKIRNYQNRQYYKNEKAAVFQMMLAIHPETVESMLETLQIGRDVHSDVKNSLNNDNYDTENKTDILIANALKNPTIVSNIFQFLSLENIKNCRTVCRTWNSVSEPVVRKISKIKFDYKFLAMDFLKVSKYFPYPDLQFKAFKFLLDIEKEKLDPDERCPKEGLSEFLTKFGMNIQSLDLSWIKNIRSFLSHTPNLTELNFLGVSLNSYYNRHLKNDPMIRIPWSVLRFIKILCLRQTVIEVESDQELTRITPLKVHLVEVRFFVGGCYPAEINLNNYIDFTKVTDVHISVGSTSKQIQQFDWAKDTFVAKRVLFSQTRFVNVGKSKCTVDCLKLYNHYLFSEKTFMSIKQIILEEGSISLAALPISLEKLAICRKNSTNIDSSEPIFLPKLNYLSYEMGNELNFLSHFDNCPNLTDMEITGTNTIDTHWLPRNIKKLKVELSSGEINVFCGLTVKHFDLDILILDYVAAKNLNDLKFDILRPKVLVLVIRCSYVDEEIAFPSFIRRNENLDKIYVQFGTGSLPSVFSESPLSSIVDKESEYYEFINGRGKAITPEEFFPVRRSLNMRTAMYGFWGTIYKEEEHLESIQEYNEGGFSYSENESQDEELNDNDNEYGGYNAQYEMYC